MKKITNIFTFLTVATLPIVSVFAQGTDGTSIAVNPLKNVNTLEDLMPLLAGLISDLAAIAAVFFLIWSGFKFVVARGNPGKLDEAKSNFFYGVIGLAIMIGAKVIEEIISNTLTSTLS